MINIVNDGPAIKSTNYWDTEHAMRGLCYLSGNAGVWRLLVPPEAEVMLPEMRTGHRVVIELSMHTTGHIDVVFDDRTETPFSIAIDKRQIDRKIESGESHMSVWTRRGCELLLPCNTRI